MQVYRLSPRLLQTPLDPADAPGYQAAARRLGEEAIGANDEGERARENGKVDFF